MRDRQLDLFNPAFDETLSLPDYWRRLAPEISFANWLWIYVTPFKRVHPDRQFGDWCNFSCAVCHRGREAGITPIK